jgi:hypothetical protein
LSSPGKYARFGADITKTGCPLILDFVVAKLKPAPIQLSVPGHPYRFNRSFSQRLFSTAKGLRHVVDVIDAGAHCAQDE